MSLFCSISGQAPLQPVLSTKSGHVYEKELVLKYLRENDGRDPITGDMLAETDLVEIKTAPSTPSAPPRPPTLTSVPALLHVLQNEWDSTMLECLELRRAGGELRQELSHALYKEDAAMRVLARVTRERDEAREALASVRATLGDSITTSADVEMDVEPEVTAGVQGSARSVVEETAKTLGSTRKKRKPAADYTTVEVVKTFVQTLAIPSLHGTKPPGVTALDIGHDAASTLLVTGGNDKTVQVYDRSTGKIVANLKGHTKKVTSVLFTPAINDSNLPNHIISSSLDKTVRIFSPNGNAKTLYALTVSLSQTDEVNALALHPSGTLVAAALADGTFTIIDLSSEKPNVILTLSLPVEAAEGTANTAIAFHPDGAMVGVGSSDSILRIYDLLSGTCVATFTDHSLLDNPGAIKTINFSENGYLLASGCQTSNQVKIFDLRKLSNTHSIQLPLEHKINTLCWDYSAQFLAVGGTDVRVYQNKSFELLSTVEENQSEIMDLKWGDKGGEIVVVGLDRNARILGPPQVEE